MLRERHIYALNAQIVLKQGKGLNNWHAFNLFIKNSTENWRTNLSKRSQRSHLILNSYFEYIRKTASQKEREQIGEYAKEVRHCARETT